jgi:hypothetical protein
MKLHPITWLLVVLSALELVAALINFSDGARSLSLNVMPSINTDPSALSWGAFIARSLPTFTYALGWLGTAAMVEFLFRIWHELVAMRSAKSQ